jgi:hypothetical protein
MRYAGNERMSLYPARIAVDAGRQSGQPVVIEMKGVSESEAQHPF